MHGRMQVRLRLRSRLHLHVRVLCATAYMQSIEIEIEPQWEGGTEGVSSWVGDKYFGSPRKTQFQ